MTPKEKAKELVEKFEPHARLIVDPGVNVGRKEHAKQCALIVVAEMKKIYARDSVDRAFWNLVESAIGYL